VADKGYHSGACSGNCTSRKPELHPEPEEATELAGEGKAESRSDLRESAACTRRTQTKRLQKLRSELTERSFAHLYETVA